jgi:hypothetical protein
LVPFDEMDDTRPASHNLWNPATNLFEVAVFRRHGAPLIVKNLPLRTADRLRKAMIGALRERRSWLTIAAGKRRFGLLS